MPKKEQMPRILSNADVKKFSDRIISIENEKDTLLEDLKSIYEEADNVGIDKKALRVAIKISRKENDKSHQKQVNTYLEIMGQLPLFHE